MLFLRDLMRFRIPHCSAPEAKLSHTPAPKEISSQFVLTLQARALRASLMERM
jgi:hypothetical protein